MGSNRFWSRVSTSVIQREITRSLLKGVACSTHHPGKSLIFFGFYKGVADPKGGGVNLFQLFLQTA